MGEIWYDDTYHQQARVRFWWKEPKTKMHEAVFAHVHTLRSEQRSRARANVHHVRLYGNLDVMGLDVDTYSLVDNYEEHMTYNVIESAVDTIHADIIAQRGRVMFLTDGGNWKQRQRAKGLTQFTDGQFHHTGMHTDAAPKACLDALVLGTGFVTPFIDPQTSRPAVERTFTGEIHIDDAESQDGKPRAMFRLKTVPRESVIASWAKENPSLVEKLRQTRESERDGVRKKTLADMVDIIEAWHLPNRPCDGDTPDRDVIAAGGVHFIGVENATIRMQPWRKPYFPPTPLRYKDRNLGYFGKGVGEILDGGQIGINELLWKIHLSLKLAGPKVFVSPNSQMNTAHFDNEVWGIIETLEMPHMAVFESVPPDLFRQLLQEIEQAYNLVGVNMMAAQGGLPPGLEGGSGRALRLYSDTKSKRFIRFKQNYEQLHIDVATKLIDLTRDHQKESEPYELLVPNDDGTAKLLKWKDVDLPADKYIMQAWPTSYLSSSPSSRVRDIEDLLKLAPQLQEHVFHLLDFPDLKAVAKLLTSEVEIARQYIERIVYDGEELAPEPMMKLEATLELARRYYLQARLERAPEENLEKLRVFMVTLEQMIADATAAAPPPAPPGPPMLGAPPGAPSGPPALPPGPMPPMGPA